MAVRTTIADVENIMDTIATDDQIDAMIASANRIVNGALSGEGLSTVLLTDIEKWVTAHLLSLTFDRQPYEKKIDDVTEKYPASFRDSGFSMTSYGEVALKLDTTGLLRDAGRKKAIIEAIESFE